MENVTSTRQEEIRHFSAALALFRKGQLNADAFWALRMPLGVYTQRQPGLYMIRLKMPGGRILPRQMIALAKIGEQLSGSPTVHLTTRQNFQIAAIPEARVAQVLRRLHRAGLSTQEAGGACMRNIVACPLAGVCPNERFNTNSMVEPLAQRYLGYALTRHLPRKFKMGISGCDADCAQGTFQDLGISAVVNAEGQPGFRVTMGGGLGVNPRQAPVLEEWITEHELPLVIEAVLRMHNHHSDREKKSRSRVKFLWERFGTEWVHNTYQQERALVAKALPTPLLDKIVWLDPQAGDSPGAEPRSIWPQRQAGLVAVPIHAPLGNLTLGQLRGVGELAHALGLKEARVTTGMNLLLPGVPQGRLPQVLKGLEALRLRTVQAGDDVKACSGSQHCNLGLTAAPLLAGRLTGGAEDLKIRVSGCPNGCALSELGDIGLLGEVRRPHNTPLPYYRLVVGGRGWQSGGLGRSVVSLPAARVEQAVERLRTDYAGCADPGQSFHAWAQQQPESYFTVRLQDLIQVSEADSVQMAAAHGAQHCFDLRTGANECAGPRKVNVLAAFSQAAHEREYRQAFVTGNHWDEALESAQAMLFQLGMTLLSNQFNAPMTSLEQVALYVNRRPPPGSLLGEQLMSLTRQLRFVREQKEPEATLLFMVAVDRWTLGVADHWRKSQPTLRLAPLLPEVMVDESPHLEEAGRCRSPTDTTQPVAVSC